ncbi:hypothetical protein BZL30_4465 [Mycobacterium kansasii]|uniref:Uncharacterized protein n=1 Tax=Mycobacterium kansasii TaxID=1768 RepID=A0A1V3X3X7_MYCKA|nr:hypothetical protein BZL30_4465 [Mycobacterium kansasii]
MTSAVTYWSNAGAVKRNEASDLPDRRTQLGVNQGRTAEDLLDRYWRGEQRLTTIAHQCQVKSEQSDRVADAVNHLRDRLKEIAKSGNEEIDQIISGQGSTESKVAAVNAVIATKNATAANAAGIAMSNLVDATQRVLDVTIGGDARRSVRGRARGIRVATRRYSARHRAAAGHYRARRAVRGPEDGPRRAVWTPDAAVACPP